jgi:YgiT-type zinc finger domain-containing protein
MTPPSETAHVLCPSCHVGHLREELSTYTQWHAGQLVVVPNVPSQVCDYCGETNYHPVVLERLQQLLRAGVHPSDNGAPVQRITQRPSA